MTVIRASIVCLALAGLQACNSLGPSALRQGRPAYNEAIAATNAEQTLAWIVRIRYGLPASLLAVSSITANVKFASTASVDLGIGPSQSYAGNLVPFSGGVIYDENPTISYVPLQGEKHMRALLAPVDVDLVGAMLNLNFEPAGVLAILVKRVNSAPNAAFHFDSSQESDQRFAQLLAIITRLGRADKLAFVASVEETRHHHIWIHDHLPDHGEDVRTLLELLSIDGIEVDGTDILLPVVGALKRSTNQSIAIQTRSLLDLARIAAASVEVPEVDHQQGLVVNFPKLGLAGQSVRVRRASERPPTAAAATRFRNWWYYIAGDDTVSKQYFLMFQALLSVQLSDGAAAAGAPVLTVPVN